MKKELIGILICTLLISVAVAPSTAVVSNIENMANNELVSNPVTIGKTIYVDDEGDGDYISIQDAVDSASDGDIIEVYSGKYFESVRIDKQLTIIGIDYELGSGNDSGRPVIKRGNKEEIFTVKARCNISGLSFRYSQNYTEAGIVLYSDDNIIYNNSIKANFGIRLWESSNNIIYNNYIQKANIAITVNFESYNNQIYENHLDGNTYGIRLGYPSENNKVYNNTVYQGDVDGILISKSYNNTIFHNTIMKCENGINLWMERRDYDYGEIVYENNISNCGCGIKVTGKFHEIFRNSISNCGYGIRMKVIDTITPIPCCANDVYDNNIFNNNKAGMYLEGVYTSEIYRNNISGSKIYGMYLFESELNDIFENNIVYSKNYGIHLWWSENNLIYHNNFIDNYLNAWCDGGPHDRKNTWNLDYVKDGGGNYWSDYTGEDKNGDGIGDSPYIIQDMDKNPFNNDKDKYPLMEPDGRPDVKIKSVNEAIQNIHKNQPRNHQIANSLLLKLLERFPNVFPILRQLFFN